MQVCGNRTGIAQRGSKTRVVSRQGRVLPFISSYLPVCRGVECIVLGGRRGRAQWLLCGWRACVGGQGEPAEGPTDVNRPTENHTRARQKHAHTERQAKTGRTDKTKEGARGEGDDWRGAGVRIGGRHKAGGTASGRQRTHAQEAARWMAAARSPKAPVNCLFALAVGWKRKKKTRGPKNQGAACLVRVFAFPCLAPIRFDSMGLLSIVADSIGAPNPNPGRRKQSDFGITAAAPRRAIFL